MLGIKFKIVVGFRSSADVFLAMERGEVDGICESLDSIMQRKPDWIPNKTVNVLLQAGAESRPELKGVPNVIDLARNEEDKQAHRIPLRRAGHRPAVHRAAGTAAGAPENAARCLRRDHEGSGVRRRRQDATSSISNRSMATSWRR